MPASKSLVVATRNIVAVGAAATTAARRTTRRRRVKYFMLKVTCYAAYNLLMLYEFNNVFFLKQDFSQYRRQYATNGGETSASTVGGGDGSYPPSSTSTIKQNYYNDHDADLSGAGRVSSSCETSVIVYCDVTSYLQSAMSRTRRRKTTSRSNNNQHTSSGGADTELLLTPEVELTHSMILAHLNKTLQSIKEVFVDLSPVTKTTKILLDSSKADEKVVDTIEHLLLFDELNNAANNSTKYFPPLVLLQEKVEIVNIHQRIQKHPDHTTFLLSSMTTKMTKSSSNNTTSSTTTTGAFSSSSSSLGVLSCIQIVLDEIETEFVYVIMSNQPFANPPYRFMTKNRFNARKWTVPLNFYEPHQQSSRTTSTNSNSNTSSMMIGGNGATSTTTTSSMEEPQRPIRMNHRALCWAIQTFPNQLGQQPIRFVSSNYASRYMKDSGVFFNTCHQKQRQQQQQQQQHDKNGKEQHYYQHHPLHLLVNQETIDIVDDPERYFAYLTNEEKQRQRIMLEKEEHRVTTATRQQQEHQYQHNEPLVLPSSSRPSSLHFFKSYDNLLQDENSFATTQYYRDRRLGTSGANSISSSVFSRNDHETDTTTGNDPCLHGQYVYGRPFTRIAHFLYAYVYTGEIYVQTLEK